MNWKYYVGQYLPNTLTLVNLFCGCLAIVCILWNFYEIAFIFISLSAIADYLDGLAARMLNSFSPIGKDLDSLADVVSFGVVPGAIFFKLLLESFDISMVHFNLDVFRAVPGFLISAFAGLRLAKFNNDPRQMNGFLGLPVPAQTLYVMGLQIFILYNGFGLGEYFSNPYFLYANILILSYLMNCELPLISLKFDKFSFASNRYRYVFLLICGILFIALGRFSLSPIILFYIGFSIILKYYYDRKEKYQHED